MWVRAVITEACTGSRLATRDAGALRKAKPQPNIVEGCEHTWVVAQLEKPLHRCPLAGRMRLMLSPSQAVLSQNMAGYSNQCNGTPNLEDAQKRHLRNHSYRRVAAGHDCTAAMRTVGRAEVGLLISHSARYGAAQRLPLR